MAASTNTGVPDAPRILLASRSSEFKEALVTQLVAMMAFEGMRLDIVGVDALEATESDRYDVVVVISTCLAWGFDDKVRSFIERQANHSHMIFVTTSAAGDWMPDKGELAYDAISSASELADVDGVARNIMSGIHAVVHPLNR